jgi:hypothetical protein
MNKVLEAVVRRNRKLFGVNESGKLAAENF